MEQFLSLVGMQAVKLALRSGIALTSSYALKQYSSFLKTVDDDQLCRELKALQTTLDNKIKIITPAIDLIELGSGQGNSALESATSLTTSMKREIALLGRKIASMAIVQTDHAAIRHVIADIQALIARIDNNIPLLQLAIAASGASLSTTLPDSVSPSRMLQASAFLMIADTQFTTSPPKQVQVGPDFIVSLYMIFKGYWYMNADEATHPSNAQRTGKEGLQKPVWQEVLHKARLRLHRMPNVPARKEDRESCVTHFQEYSYSLEINEDRNDQRLHHITKSSPLVNNTDLIPVTEISKLFYTNSAAILNIRDDMEADNTPILLIKREIDATNSHQPDVINKLDDETQRSIDCQLLEEGNGNSKEGNNIYIPQRPSQFPSYLDPEWIALEMYSADASTDEYQDDESETESADRDSEELENPQEPDTDAEEIVAQLTSLSIDPGSNSTHQSLATGDPSALHHTAIRSNVSMANNPFQSVTTSLSLLELVIRLAALQETQQQSHLSIPDHILTCFLNGTLRPDKAEHGK